MKKYIFLLIVTVAFISKQSSSQTTDSTVNALLAIDESQFINKPLDSIIAVLPSGYISMKIYSGGHQYTARCLSLLYPNRVWIDLHVRSFTHMSPVDTNKVWNISQMRQENLYKTVIYKHNTCYRNCDTH